MIPINHSDSDDSQALEENVVPQEPVSRTTNAKKPTPIITSDNEITVYELEKQRQAKQNAAATQSRREKWEEEAVEDKGVKRHKSLKDIRKKAARPEETTSTQKSSKRKAVSPLESVIPKRTLPSFSKVGAPKPAPVPEPAPAPAPEIMEVESPEALDSPAPALGPFVVDDDDGPVIPQRQPTRADLNRSVEDYAASLRKPEVQQAPETITKVQPVKPNEDSSSYRCTFKYIEPADQAHLTGRELEIGFFDIIGLSPAHIQLLRLDTTPSWCSTKTVSSSGLAQYLQPLRLTLICADIMVPGQPSAFWTLVNLMRAFNCAAVVSTQFYTAYVFRKQDDFLRPLSRDLQLKEVTHCKVIFIPQSKLIIPDQSTALTKGEYYRQSLARMSGLIPQDFRIYPKQNILILGPECFETTELSCLLSSRSLKCSSFTSQDTITVKIHHIFIHRLLTQHLHKLHIITKYKKTDCKFWLFGTTVPVAACDDSLEDPFIFPSGSGILHITAAAFLESPETVLTHVHATTPKWRVQIPASAYQSASHLTYDLDALIDRGKLFVTESETVLTASSDQLEFLHTYRRSIVLCKDQEQVTSLTRDWIDHSAGLEFMTLNDFTMT